MNKCDLCFREFELKDLLIIKGVSICEDCWVKILPFKKRENNCPKCNREYPDINPVCDFCDNEKSHPLLDNCNIGEKYYDNR